MARALGTIVASAARTATGNETVARGTSDHNNLALTLNVTASSGTTPSLTLAVQWSADGTNFGAADPADAFAAVTGNGVVSKAFTVKAAFWRLAWTISGTTPSFTFTVDAVTY